MSRPSWVEDDLRGYIAELERRNAQLEREKQEAVEAFAVRDQQAIRLERELKAREQKRGR